MNSSQNQERGFDNQDQVLIDTISDQPVLLDFDGGQLSSDAGLLLLKSIDTHLGLLSNLAAVLRDDRDPDRIQFTREDLMRQRVFQIAAGYEDQDDCDHLRGDPIFKVLLGRLPATGADLASQPTMSRFENGVSRTELFRLAEVLLAHFIDSYTEAPAVIVLDFDDTEDVVHGTQEQARFNAYVGHYCFLPLHVYEGLSGRLITTLLKPGVFKGLQVQKLLHQLVCRLRQAWPGTRIIFRGDSHFMSPEVMAYCEEHDLHYVTGLATNAVLKRLAAATIAETEACFTKRSSEKVVRFHSFSYQAKTWSESRRVIVKVEVSAQGTNVRFIVTDLQQARARRLYRDVYCARGQMENYIKDHKVALQSDRTSCHRFLANQFRLFLHSAAYVLLWTLRHELLAHSSYKRVRFQTLQVRLLKLGASVREYSDHVQISLPYTCAVEAVLRQGFAPGLYPNQQTPQVKPAHAYNRMQGVLCASLRNRHCNTDLCWIKPLKMCSSGRAKGVKTDLTHEDAVLVPVPITENYPW